jgi:hypothetical protein
MYLMKLNFSIYSSEQVEPIGQKIDYIFGIYIDWIMLTV